MALAVVVLQVEIEPCGIPQIKHGRWREGEHDGILDSPQSVIGALLYCIDAEARCFALAPVLEMNEPDSGILAAAAEAPPGNGEDRVGRVFLLDEKVIFHLLEDAVGASLGGADRRLHHGDHE